ncbi:hypothetical protein D9619_010131 [Psilocybe cf. subviscida]|uniref:Uncharacterized protein n=1 Tax=Psilocybe cf. subviscida TaxID=2480587 RepID=A0A8H5ESC9_9AGAR|nr:hypothetical protein D9619_010131 [Psilocybe cf. subviscida]
MSILGMIFVESGIGPEMSINGYKGELEYKTGVKETDVRTDVRLYPPSNLSSNHAPRLVLRATPMVVCCRNHVSMLREAYSHTLLGASLRHGTVPEGGTVKGFRPFRATTWPVVPGAQTNRVDEQAAGYRAKAHANGASYQLAQDRDERRRL